MRLFMSTGSLSRLPAVGDEVTVFTHLHVREDELSLFGFESTEERELFEKLITVSGVGPRVALAALSVFAPAALIEAIVHEDDGLVATIPGVGRKTAQRLIIELKDKVGGVGADLRPHVSGGAAAEVREALAGMGFGAAEIVAALKGFDGPDEARHLLRYALKRLGGGS
jgi:Holliday junction DNA helicase RuvA